TVRATSCIIGISCSGSAMGRAGCARMSPPAVRWRHTVPACACWLASPPSQLDLLHLLRPCGAGAHEEREVGAGRDIARAHPHELGDQVWPRREPAYAAMLAVPAAGRDGVGIGLAHPRMIVLSGDAPVRQQII